MLRCGSARIKCLAQSDHHSVRVFGSGEPCGPSPQERVHPGL